MIYQRPALQQAIERGLARSSVVALIGYPGARAYPLSDRVTVLPLAQLATGGAAILAPEIG